MRNTSLLVAPAEPAIENDLPLDLSCNSRRNEEPMDEDEEDEELVVDCADHHIRAESKGRHGGVVMMRSIGGPPSPPRSPADFRALADLGYVAYHRHLMAQHWQQQARHRQEEQDDEDDDDLSLVIRHSVSPPGSMAGQDSANSGEEDSDSSQQPMDLAGLGPMNPKAYKKSLMKRYCKSSCPPLFSLFSFVVFSLSLSQGHQES